VASGLFLIITINILQAPSCQCWIPLSRGDLIKSYIDNEDHIPSKPSQRRQRGVVKHLRLEIDGENAFDQRKRDVHTAITPSRLHEVLQTEDSAALSVLCLVDSGIEVVIERVDEALPSSDSGDI